MIMNSMTIKKNPAQLWRKVTHFQSLTLLALVKSWDTRHELAGHYQHIFGIPFMSTGTKMEWPDVSANNSQFKD